MEDKGIVMKVAHSLGGRYQNEMELDYSDDENYPTVYSTFTFLDKSNMVNINEYITPFELFLDNVIAEIQSLIPNTLKSWNDLLEILEPYQTNADGAYLTVLNYIEKK